MPFNLENEWKPTKKQAAFLSIPFSIREALYGGGAGSAKTELLLMFALVHGWHRNPRFKQLLMRCTTKQIKKEILPRSQEIYPKFGAVFNEGDMVWTFPREDQFGSGQKPSGARIFFGHCENESDVHIYDSMEVNLFTPDEITSLTYSKYSYIGFTRLRSGDPANLPAIIRAGGMPGDVGHTWVKSRFVKPAPEGNKRIIGKSGNSRIYIHATVKDNPHADPNYIKILAELPEAERKAKMGDWDSYLGQVFEEFRDTHYEDEPANAVHVIQPFEIPTWWPKIVAIDWGFKAKCSIGWGAISPEKKLYIYRHQHWYGTKISLWAPEVKFFIEKENPADIIICHSANQHRGDPHTILEQVSEAIGAAVRLGERNRLAGKTLLHEYLRWEQKKPLNKETIGEFDPNVATWIRTNKGLEAYNEYVSVFSAAPVVEDIPKLLFFNKPDVKLIWESVKACSYPQSQKDGKKIEDVAPFEGDDEYDMLRMLLHAADSFFGVAVDASAKLERVASVVSELKQSQDMTVYYRQMAAIDSEESGLSGFKLFHRGSH